MFSYTQLFYFIHITHSAPGHLYFYICYLLFFKCYKYSHIETEIIYLWSKVALMSRQTFLYFIFEFRFWAIIKPLSPGFKFIDSETRDYRVLYIHRVPMYDLKLTISIIPMLYRTAIKLQKNKNNFNQNIVLTNNQCNQFIVEVKDQKVTDLWLETNYQWTQ